MSDASSVPIPTFNASLIPITASSPIPLTCGFSFIKLARLRTRDRVVRIVRLPIGYINEMKNIKIELAYLATNPGSLTSAATSAARFKGSFGGLMRWYGDKWKLYGDRMNCKLDLSRLLPEEMLAQKYIT